MIEKMEISGVHMKVEPKLKKYVTKKMGAMDKYMPRHARESAHLEVKLKEAKIKEKKEYTCEVVLFLPHDTIRIAETTMNIFAAVDITETKLKNQIRKYKETHARKRIPGRIIAKFRSRRSV